MFLFIKSIIVSMAIISISGCYSVKTVKIGEIIKQNSTIEIPVTGLSVMDIKSSLMNNGWKIMVFSNNVNRVRLDSKNSQNDSSNDYDTAFRLIITESLTADSLVIGLNASLVSNKTKEELLSMYFDSKGMGIYGPDEVAQDIVKELRSIGK